MRLLLQTCYAAHRQSIFNRQHSLILDINILELDWMNHEKDLFSILQVEITLCNKYDYMSDRELVQLIEIF